MLAILNGSENNQVSPYRKRTRRACERGSRMVNDTQVLRYRRRRVSGQSQEVAAAAAGMTAKTARKWEKGLLPSHLHKKPRHWRTRKDPFKDVWDKVVVPLLKEDEEEILEATTLFDFLQDKYPGQFEDGQIRTLQRRLKDWRAFHGPPKEVFFPQEHPPGREGQIDFTHCTELGITINGEPFFHLIFQFILSCSGFRWVQLALGETYEALSSGIQGAVWSLGGTPEHWRTDNLSAATHHLKSKSKRQLTPRYETLARHYQCRPTQIFPGRSHENGIVEKGHDILKRALKQHLVFRLSRNFSSVEEYSRFVESVITKLNRGKLNAFEDEQKYLKPLPRKPLPDYTDELRTVSRNSLIRVRNQTYSVPSRLIGYKVIIRIHPAKIEVRYRDKLVEVFPRLRGERTRRVDYRHIIASLVRKPGAFARYKFREELFPSLVFRQAYDALFGWRGERADVDYVRILHLAATTMECEVSAALTILLEKGTRFDYGEVKMLVAPPRIASHADFIRPLVPDLNPFDNLLTGEINDTLKNQSPQIEQWQDVCNF